MSDTLCTIFTQLNFFKFFSILSHVEKLISSVDEHGLISSFQICLNASAHRVTITGVASMALRVTAAPVRLDSPG